MTKVIELTEYRGRIPGFSALQRNFISSYPFLLESVVHGVADARFDILFIKQGAGMPDANDKDEVYASSQEQTKFLDEFSAIWELNKTSQPVSENIPFKGGWFVYLAYELAGEIETSLTLPFHKKNNGDRENTLLAYACRIRAALVWDHVEQSCSLICEPECNAKDLLAHIRVQLKAVSNTAQDEENWPDKLSLVEEPEKNFVQAAGKVKQYIKDGDVFQVNLSREWHIDIPWQQDNVLASRIYNRLKKANPAPFAGIAYLGEMAVISSSPERLCHVKNGYIYSRPIAGTRPRGETVHHDKALVSELHAHPKERAEHIMLIDLIRNDLGRISEPGTVKVDELMVSESYQYVHHIVSQVSGKLRSDVSPVDVIKAVFPGGTITGCPKVRCMQIIAELEAVPRGAYTGSMGYINLDGTMDLNILIRTMTLHSRNEGYFLSFRAGAGLVFDSIAEKEVDETRAKARGLLKALDTDHA